MTLTMDEKTPAGVKPMAPVSPFLTIGLTYLTLFSPDNNIIQKHNHYKLLTTSSHRLPVVGGRVNLFSADIFITKNELSTPILSSFLVYKVKICGMSPD